MLVGETHKIDVSLHNIIIHFALRKDYNIKYRNTHFLVETMSYHCRKRLLVAYTINGDINVHIHAIDTLIITDMYCVIPLDTCVIYSFYSMLY